MKCPADDFVRNFVGKKRIWSVPELIRAKDIMLEGATGSKIFSLIKCLELMRAANVDSLIMVDSAGKIEGVVYAKDILSLPEPKGSARDVMREVEQTVGLNDNIIHVLEVMQQKNMTAAPVVDEDGVMAGIITRSSLVTTLSRQYLEKEDASV